MCESGVTGRRYVREMAVSSRYVRMVGGPYDGHMIPVDDWSVAVAVPVMLADGTAITPTMAIELDTTTTPPTEVVHWSVPADPRVGSVPTPSIAGPGSARADATHESETRS